MIGLGELTRGLQILCHFIPDMSLYSDGHHVSYRRCVIGLYPKSVHRTNAMDASQFLHQNREVWTLWHTKKFAFPCTEGSSGTRGGSTACRQVKVLFCPILSLFRKGIAFWKDSRFRPFVLVTAACRWIGEWGSFVAWYWEGRNWSTRRKTCRSTTLLSTNVTWTDMYSNLCLSADRPATNALSRSAAYFLPAKDVNALWWGSDRAVNTPILRCKNLSTKRK